MSHWCSMRLNCLSKGWMDSGWFEIKKERKPSGPGGIKSWKIECDGQIMVWS